MRRDSQDVVLDDASIIQRINVRDRQNADKKKYP